MSLYTVTSIYTAIVFYFMYGETLSVSKIISMGLLFICVVLLVIESSKSAEETSFDAVDVSDESRLFYGALAVTLSLLTPLLWTFMYYSIR